MCTPWTLHKMCTPWTCHCTGTEQAGHGKGKGKEKTTAARVFGHLTWIIYLCFRPNLMLVEERRGKIHPIEESYHKLCRNLALFHHGTRKLLKVQYVNNKNCSNFFCFTTMQVYEWHLFLSLFRECRDRGSWTGGPHLTRCIGNNIIACSSLTTTLHRGRGD